MTTKLTLGVLDVPYTDATGKRTTATSTGDVAVILEDKYGVMGAFADASMERIADAWAEAQADELAAILAGAPSDNGNAVAEVAMEVETMFRQFIDSREMDGQSGVPTQASLKGVNHRLKHPYAKGNPIRPSFKDTGLYEASFRAQIETND